MQMKAHRWVSSYLALPLRLQLMLILVAFLLLLTVALGWVAYRTSLDIIKHDATRAVGMAANARKQILIQLLSQERERANNFLNTAHLICDTGGYELDACLHSVLEDFVALEGATAARFQYQGIAPILFGEGAA